MHVDSLPLMENNPPICDHCSAQAISTEQSEPQSWKYHLNRFSRRWQKLLIGYDWLTVKSCARIINGHGKLMSQCGFPRLEFVEDGTAVHWVLAVRLTVPQSWFDFQNYTIHLVGGWKKSPFKKTILWYKIGIIFFQCVSKTPTQQKKLATTKYTLSITMKPTMTSVAMSPETHLTRIGKFDKPVYTHEQ